MRSILGAVRGISAPRGGLVVIFSRFRDVLRVSGGVSGRLHSVVRRRANVGCVFLNDRRSVVASVFRQIGSPFCRFKVLVELGGVPCRSFGSCVASELKSMTRRTTRVTSRVLTFADYRPCCARRLSFTI